MRDFIFLSFFLGHRAGSRARKLLAAHGLLETAKVSWLGTMHTGVSLRLPADDLRLASLREELQRRKVDAFIRLDREYARSDLDQAPWLLLRVATAGLLGGIDYGQAYDTRKACRTCGAGVVPMAPLLADLGRMGSKDLDHLIYESHLVATARVAKAMMRFSGVEAVAVRSARRQPDSRFKWLRVTGSFPPMHPATTGIMTEDLCKACGRAGHGCDLMAPEVPTFARLPRSVKDINLTWEYFGNWRQERHPTGTQLVGGGRDVIVSQSVRQELLRLEVRRLKWTPIART